MTIVFATASTASAASGGGEVFRVTNTLCSAPEYAIEYKRERDSGEVQEMAIDAVAKREGKPVCGIYTGQAVVQEQEVIAHDGSFYRLTAWRFLQDSRVAWVAESTFDPKAVDTHI